MNRRTAMTALAVSPLAACATITQIGQAEGLIDATGQINVFRTFVGIAQVVLSAASIVVPGAGLIREAIVAGQAIVAAIEAQNGATASQIAAIGVHTQTLNEQAAPHGKFVSGDVS